MTLIIILAGVVGYLIVGTLWSLLALRYANMDKEGMFVVLSIVYWPLTMFVLVFILPVMPLLRKLHKTMLRLAGRL